MRDAALDAKLNEIIRLLREKKHLPQPLRESANKDSEGEIKSHQPTETANNTQTGWSRFLLPIRILFRWWMVAWKSFAVIGAILTVWWGVEQFRQNVSIDLFLRLDPSDPFSERFLLSNNGPFPIYHVEYSCEQLDSKNRYPRIDHFGPVFSVIPVLEPGDKRSLRCTLFRLLPVEDTIMQVKVVYSRPFPLGNQSKSARFAILKDAAGLLMWIPIGPTEGNVKFWTQEAFGNKVF